MIQTKPSNIFDFFAPTGGAPKIADFNTNVFKSAGTNPVGIPISSSPQATTVNLRSTSNIPINSTESNTWKWVIGGIVVAGIAYFIYKRYEEDNKKDKKNVLHVIQPSDD